MAVRNDERDGYDDRLRMDPRDLSSPAWLASTVGEINDAQRRVAEVGSVTDATSVLDSIRDLTDRVRGVAGSASATPAYEAVVEPKRILDSIPDTTKMITGAIPAVTGTIRGPVPDVTSLMGGVVGDFTRGVSLAEYQRSIGAGGAATRSPAFGGTFQPPTGLERYEQVVATASAVPTSTPSPVVPWKGERPRLWPDRQAPIHEPLRDPFLPSRPRQREPVKHYPAPAPAPEVRPEEVGPELAQAMTRRHRQEAKGLLVALGLDLELEHLEAIERRMLAGGRPDHLHAALSASLLLEGVANRIFPPRDELWISRFGKEHEIGAEHVRNRLSAFAEPMLSELETVEHRLFIAEFDLVGRWTGEGHHVVFSAEENAEAFRAFLKILATVARAHRLS